MLSTIWVLFQLDVFGIIYLFAKTVNQIPDKTCFEKFYKRAITGDSGSWDPKNPRFKENRNNNYIFIIINKILIRLRDFEILNSAQIISSNVCFLLKLFRTVSGTTFSAYIVTMLKSKNLENYVRQMKFDEKKNLQTERNFYPNL